MSIRTTAEMRELARNRLIESRLTPNAISITGLIGNLIAAVLILEEHFVLAGLTERFDESLLLLRRALGWRNVLYRRENAAPRSTGSSPDPDAVEAIRECNRLEQELYDFCSRRFGDLVAAAGPSLERELQRFRKRNAVYGALSTSASRARARGRRARV